MANTMAGAIETPSTPPPTPKAAVATLTQPPTTPTRKPDPQQQPQQHQTNQPPSPQQSSALPSSQAPSQVSSLNAQTPWGCQIQTFPTSLAPKSLILVHNPTPGKCRCHGREDVIVKDYILRWVSWRIDELKEHPVKATTWARASCEYLGIPGALDGILGRVERVFAGDL